MNTKLIVYSLSTFVILGVSGCSGGGDGGCSTVEPAWTQTVAPMVTREDGGEATALVHAVDVVASGQLFDTMIDSSKKVNKSLAQREFDILKTMLAPNVSMYNTFLSGLQAKSVAKTPLTTYPSGVPIECSYGGTMTINYTDTQERFVSVDRNVSTTYTFDNCIEDPDIIEEIAQGLYSTVSSVFPEVLSTGVSGNEASTERVTLNGEIGARLRSFNGESRVPDWMGPPSWATPADNKPVSVVTSFQRAEIFTTDFSAEFTTEGTEDSLLFESNMDLYFEYNTIFDFIWNIDGNTVPMDFEGFIYEGSYLIVGANGCIQATETEGTTTHDLLSVRALKLETVGYLGPIVLVREKDTLGTVDMPGMISLNGFIETSLNDGDFTFSLKADGFYRADRYFEPTSLNVDPKTTMPIFMIGYLGSECLDGMLFVTGEFGRSYGDNLPTYGDIGFFAEVPDGPMTTALGGIEFIEQLIPHEKTLIAEPMPVEYEYAANLYVAEELMGTYTSWSSLIGENACTMPPVEAP